MNHTLTCFTRRLHLALLVGLLTILPGEGMAAMQYHWVQLMAGKAVGERWLPDVSIRAIVDQKENCPALYDGQHIKKAKVLLTLQERVKQGQLASNPLFAEIKLCEKTIAADDNLLQQWSVGYLANDKNPTAIRLPNLQGGALPLSQLITSGCTGCRDNKDQYCATTPPASGKSSAKAQPWQLAALMAQAAPASEQLPPLWVHLGDMRYSGQKDGVADSWSHNKGKLGWKEEFFTPYATLLAQSWSVILRGNHEGCFVPGNSWDNSGWQNRGEGWLYFFGSGTTTCQSLAGQQQDMLPPIAFDALAYGGSFAQPVASQQAIRLILLDRVRTGDGRDKDPGTTQALYTAQNRQVAQQWLHTLNRNHPAWLLQHIPSYELNKKGKIESSLFSKALQDALSPAELQQVALLVSAHLHHYELAKEDDKHPLQVTVGNGGVALSGSLDKRCQWSNSGDKSALQAVQFGFLSVRFTVEGGSVNASYQMPLFRAAPGSLQADSPMVCPGKKEAPAVPDCGKASPLPACS
ncbi:MAG: metallophosphoesterase [Magnetococcales bacterium]|nr:metallophosphoesterase [Magnetococcales bacterium]